MKMKRVTISMACAVVLTTGLILGGCNNSQSSEASVNSTGESISESVTEAIKETEAPISIPENKFKENPISETVMLDENGIKITATSLEYIGSQVKLNLTIENNTDKNLSFIAGSTGTNCNAINGYMVEYGYLNSEITPGNKANETVIYDINELNLMGINEISDIQLGVDISDDDHNSVYWGAIQVKTSASDSYDYETDTYQQAIIDDALMNQWGYSIDYYTDELSYDQNGLQVLSAALITNQDGEQSFFIEVENNTQELVRAMTSNIRLNGITTYSYDWSSDPVLPNTRRIIPLDAASILDTDLWENLGFSQIEEFIFELTFQNDNGDNLTSPSDITISVSDTKPTVNASGDELYNENNIRIISKGIVSDDNDYTHMLLLFENNYSEDIIISSVSDSLSVNGYMANNYSHRSEVASGGYTLFDIELTNYNMEDLNLSSVDDIKEAEISFEIDDSNRNTLAETTLKMAY